jgi:hypothetical protein
MVQCRLDGYNQNKLHGVLLVPAAMTERDCQTVRQTDIQRRNNPISLWKRPNLGGDYDAILDDLIAPNAHNFGPIGD